MNLTGDNVYFISKFNLT